MAQQSKRKQRAEETEAALKQAARAVFAEKGYLNTKITDITAAAGRAAGSFYNHFTGKEDVLSALLGDLFEESDAAVFDEDSEHSSDFTDAGAVRWHIEEWWRFATEHADVLAALEQAAQVERSFATRLQAMALGQQRDLLGHLDSIVSAGRTLPGEPIPVISAMYAMCARFQETWHDTGGFDGTVTESQAIELLTTFVHRGLNGTDAPTHDR